MKIIGITGGVACGKSYCSNLFAQRGIKIISADEISHKISDSSKIARIKIQRAFGKGYFRGDGTMDRKAVAKLVFNNPEALKILNHILHPLIYNDILEKIAEHKNNGERLIVVEIPLMYETQMQDLTDVVVCCYASKQVQMDRLKIRGFDEYDSRKRIESQMPLDKKVEMADFAVDTSISFDYTHKQISNIIDKLIQ